MMKNFKKLHFVGIGGVGMSAIAYVVNKLGYNVSGSDEKASSLTEKLQAEGIKVYIGHVKEHIGDCDAIVVSSAIKDDNPEVVEAKRLGVPILHRSDILAELMNCRYGIAIAGAHGKTTTTSMLSCVAISAGLDPTVLIGGEVIALNGNAHYGKSDYLIAEADESDGSFLKFHPHVAIVTNVENDHMDYYHTMDDMKKAFKQFINQLSDDGKVILCFEDEILQSMGKQANGKVISYAIEQEADYRAVNIEYKATMTTYDVSYKGEILGKIKLVVPGRHNVLNSLAVVAVSNLLGVKFEKIAEVLAEFIGAKRRFEIKGQANGVLVVDDYAHHPSEIKSTLIAANQRKHKRLICVFQPHRYSRTQLLLEDFSKCFNPCDLLVLSDIYAASEKPIAGVTGQTLFNKVKENSNQEVVYAGSVNDVADYLKTIVQEGDLVITLGAGDIYKSGELLLKELQQGALCVK